MKRSMLLLMVGLLYGALTPTAWAQPSIDDLLDGEDAPPTSDTIPPQRIGVPAIEMVLGPNESGSVTGYCFDEYLIAPRRVTRFQNVLAGNNDAIVTSASGTKRTLSDAVASGDIAIRALQLDVQIINRSDEQLAVKLNRPTVLWDRAAGDVNPAALRVLDAGNRNNGSRQDQVWRVTSAERRLNLLGYEDGSMWDYDADRQRLATVAFQRENGLAETGELDMQTTGRLAKMDEALRARLRAIGFRDREGRSIKEDLGAQIRGFERYIGRSTPDSRWSPELATRLASSERVISQLNGLKAGQTNPDAAPGVVSTLSYSKGFLALVETPDGVELWSRKGTSLHFEGRDQAAIRSMDDAAAALAARATRGDRVVIYPRVGSGDMATVMIGDRRLEVDAKSLASYLDGGAMPAALAAAITPMTSNSSDLTGGGTTPQKVVIYSGPFATDRAGSGLARLGLTQPDGNRLAGALDRTYGSQIDLYTSDDLRAGAQSFKSAMGSLLRGSSLPLFADAAFAR